MLSSTCGPFKGRNNKLPFSTLNEEDVTTIGKRLAHVHTTARALKFLERWIICLGVGNWLWTPFRARNSTTIVSYLPYLEHFLSPPICPEFRTLRYPDLSHCPAFNRAIHVGDQIQLQLDDVGQFLNWYANSARSMLFFFFASPENLRAQPPVLHPSGHFGKRIIDVCHSLIAEQISTHKLCIKLSNDDLGTQPPRFQWLVGAMPAELVQIELS